MGDKTRVLICGGRDDDGPENALFLNVLIRGLAETYGKGLTIVHGNCRGVDRTVDAIARGLFIDVDPFPADWDGRGRIAGQERNQRMLDSGVAMVIAIKSKFNWKLDRGGTEDMVLRANKAHVPVYVIEPVVGGSLLTGQIGLDI